MPVNSITRDDLPSPRGPWSVKSEVVSTSFFGLMEIEKERALRKRLSMLLLKVGASVYCRGAARSVEIAHFFFVVVKSRGLQIHRARFSEITRQ